MKPFRIAMQAPHFGTQSERFAFVKPETEVGAERPAPCRRPHVPPPNRMGASGSAPLAPEVTSGGVERPLPHHINASKLAQACRGWHTRDTHNSDDEHDRTVRPKASRRCKHRLRKLVQASSAQAWPPPTELAGAVAHGGMGPGPGPSPGPPQEGDCHRDYGDSCNHDRSSPA